ncbi:MULTISPECIES: type I restriction endonuclease subunit R [unclassified Streptomyces]|uniref:type I restriction endonuclease subunit R n=1 Tax=unclassified Streptomyces TaxID=2593676 RepID=UPI00081B3CBA|nr:DEAD/DEAH box helicase family protein [Streptomyces sp. DvalAA-43]MYQ82545.1 DEAD/DEAH box helicase family protein [Streptomyces sp. SID4936]SCD43919.1 type I restriction enzyme, R subunit [Streptomyces sp. DvalAA-43]
MGDLTYEEQFERQICEDLAAHGWEYSPNDEGYDAARALFPQDVFGWFEDLAPQEWARGIGSGPRAAAAQDALLDLIVQLRATPLDNKGGGPGGTLQLLRSSVPVGLRDELKMVQWRPADPTNGTRVAAYDKVRLRIMRQVHYSHQKPHDSIDLVAFINGIPVATFELKTKFKQSIEAAVKQYAQDRNPKGEPLLAFGAGALVHFVVTESEVRMTTRLAGENTYFLPFNQGKDGGAGNPVNEDGPATAYLWERVMARDAWLDIFGSMLFVDVKTSTNLITRERKTATNVIFPRFHQWQAVSRMVEQAEAESAGGRFLIQHSAGSGKTNTIGWTAHHLSNLHDQAGRKIFDTVVVITDRTVLDDQMQRAVLQIEGKRDYVYNVDRRARTDAGSKSRALLKALQDRRRIVVVTIQTFPAVLRLLSEDDSLAGHRFAVIADEAHSSQAGATAKKVRQVLRAGGQEVDEGADVDAEDTINAFADVPTPNVSFFAFTATPKSKTVELFGRRETADAKPSAFDVYSMKQAIQEGFILDVLPRFQYYGTVYQIAEVIKKNGVNISVDDEDHLVEKTAAAKALKRFVRLHPTNISQKVEIIVEHFRANVAGMLGGHAKAMIVTSERKHALRYKVLIDKYIKSKGYDLGTLVAFSGTLDDPDFGIHDEVSEAKMNPGAGPDLAAAFAEPNYRVMIAADKFQTGFDQPLLCAMYVDKRLEDIQAVQTLSRLNRTFRMDSLVKDRVFILDFVNEPKDIQAAFAKWYEEAEIETETDPNQLHVLAMGLRTFGVFDIQDVVQFVQGVHDGDRNMITAAMGRAQDEFARKWQRAVEDENAQDVERLEQFRKNVSSFVRLYDFLSQVYDYSGSPLEDLSSFCRELAQWIKAERTHDEIDISSARLVAIEQKDKGVTNASVTQKGDKLTGPTAVGTATVKDPKMVPLLEVIDTLNTLFDDLSESAIAGLMALVIQAAKSDEMLKSRALENSLENFLKSEKVRDRILDTLLAAPGELGKAVAEVVGDGRGLNSIIAGAFHGVRLDAEQEDSAEGDTPRQ